MTDTHDCFYTLNSSSKNLYCNRFLPPNAAADALPVLAIAAVCPPAIAIDPALWLGHCVRSRP